MACLTWGSLLSRLLWVSSYATFDKLAIGVSGQHILLCDAVLTAEATTIIDVVNRLRRDMNPTSPDSYGESASRWQFSNLA